MPNEPIMQQVCECGTPIDDDLKESKYISFSRPDLDGFHGIWDGINNRYIIFDADKKWCTLECLIKSITDYEKE